MNLWQKIKLAKALNAVYSQLKETDVGHWKPVLYGIAATVGLAILTKVKADCPCLVDVAKAWPEYLYAGVIGGIGVYIQGPRKIWSPAERRDNLGGS